MSPHHVGPLDRPRIGRESLTRREHEVCALVGKGLSNADVGAALFLGSQTIKFHLTNIYSKLGIANRTELALAYETFKAELSTCCGRDIYTPFCPWCGKARVIAAPMEAAA